jgi:hypothetical protein
MSGEYEVRIELSEEELRKVSQEILVDEETGEVYADGPEFEKLMERVYNEINSGRLYNV